MLIPITAGLERINAKEREENTREKRKEKERDQGRWWNLPAPTQAIDELTGDEEQNGKQKKQCVTLGNLGAYYDLHRPYVGPILKHPHP